MDIIVKLQVKYVMPKDDTLKQNIDTENYYTVIHKEIISGLLWIYFVGKDGKMNRAPSEECVFRLTKRQDDSSIPLLENIDANIKDMVNVIKHGNIRTKTIENANDNNVVAGTKPKVKSK